MIQILTKDFESSSNWNTSWAFMNYEDGNTNNRDVYEYMLLGLPIKTIKGQKKKMKRNKN